MADRAPNLGPSTGEDPRFAAYRPAPGVADELMDAAGHMRPVWRDFIDRLAACPPEDLRERFERGDHYLRDAGVYFRQYSNDPLQEREWPLSYIPVLLHQSDWDVICDGLAQRADLLEQVMADLYGPAILIRDGHLPASLITSNPHWLRPMVGVSPAGGAYLHFLAFELGRSPDGTWFVLGDRTQAPSGAGFALENRMATSRIFPEGFVGDHVHRLAGFFADFRQALTGLAEGAAGGGGRAGILTPGPANDTYFEQTYIARYLGLPLLEGEDLLVQDARAMIRTIEGPEPLGALWRRMDAGFADPLELNPASRIGTPGLVEAARAGNLTLINALGSGLLETRAMLAFLPRIAEILGGEPLRMPNIATWWGGGADERAQMLAQPERLVVGAAGSVALPMDPEATTPLSDKLAELGPEGLAAWIEANGAGLVAQEAVHLSTTPAWRGDTEGGTLAPCPMTLRVFAARTPQGWRFMPGGYARIGPAGDTTALSMHRGGAVADVWVVSDAPVPQPTLARTSGADFRRSAPSKLPARAADNLFWLGRYVERCESAIRLVRAYHLRTSTSANPDDPLLAMLAEYLDQMGLDVSAPIPDGLIARIDMAQACSAKIRDRFSTDGWLALKDLAKTAHGMRATARPGDDCARAMGVLLRKITGFAGLIHENMYRLAGWRFLSIGRGLERADAVAGMLARFCADDAPAGALDLAVELGDSVITHQRRYRVATNRDTVLDLLALDADNPRSLLFQLTDLDRMITGLPAGASLPRTEALRRTLVPLCAELQVALPMEVTQDRLTACQTAMYTLSDQLSQAYLR